MHCQPADPGAATECRDAIDVANRWRVDLRPGREVASIGGNASNSDGVALFPPVISEMCSRSERSRQDDAEDGSSK